MSLNKIMLALLVMSAGFFYLGTMNAPPKVAAKVDPAPRVIASDPVAIETDEDRAVIAALFSPDALSPLRTISFHETVAIDDAESASEASPTGAAVADYLRTHAQERGKAECAQLAGGIARACSYLGTEVTPLNGRFFSVETRLAYLPNGSVGAVTVSDDGALHRMDVHYPGNMDDVALPLDAYPAWQRTAHGKAKAVCAKLRARHGNCVVSAVEFRETASPDEQDIIRAKAVFKINWVPDQDAGTPENDDDLLAGAPGSGFGFAKLLSMITGGGSEKSARASAPTVLRGGGAYRPSSGRSGGKFIGVPKK